MSAIESKEKLEIHNFTFTDSFLTFNQVSIFSFLIKKKLISASARYTKGRRETIFFVEGIQIAVQIALMATFFISDTHFTSPQDVLNLERAENRIISIPTSFLQWILYAKKYALTSNICIYINKNLPSF